MGGDVGGAAAGTETGGGRRRRGGEEDAMGLDGIGRDGAGLDGTRRDGGEGLDETGSAPPLPARAFFGHIWKGRTAPDTPPP